MHNIAPELADLAVPIDSLHPYRDNARTHDLDVIRESLRTNGQYRPIVVNDGGKTGRPSEILAGNGTWQAAKEEGWTEVAVTWVNVDEDGARRIVLIDNRANDLAGYDDDALAAILRDLSGEYEGTGYDNAFLDELLETMANRALEGLPEDDGDEDEDADAGTLLALVDVSVGEPRHQPEHGSRWKLGRHVLVVAKVGTEHDRWRDLLPGRVFAPYPEPYLTGSNLGRNADLLLVQPNRYLAGHLLDKHEALFPGEVEQL